MLWASAALRCVCSGDYELAPNCFSTITVFWSKQLGSIGSTNMPAISASILRGNAFTQIVATLMTCFRGE